MQEYPHPIHVTWAPSMILIHPFVHSFIHSKRGLTKTQAALKPLGVIDPPASVSSNLGIESHVHILGSPLAIAVWEEGRPDSHAIYTARALKLPDLQLPTCLSENFHSVNLADRLSA